MVFKPKLVQVVLIHILWRQRPMLDDDTSNKMCLVGLNTHWRYKQYHRSTITPVNFDTKFYRFLMLVKLIAFKVSWQLAFVLKFLLFYQRLILINLMAFQLWFHNLKICLKPIKAPSFSLFLKCLEKVKRGKLWN